MLSRNTKILETSDNQFPFLLKATLERQKPNDQSFELTFAPQNRADLMKWSRAFSVSQLFVY